jgi:hypothetical protein
VDAAPPLTDQNPPRRSPRAVWHAIGLVAAGLVAWLILQGYRQPELLLELANLRLC